MEDGLVQATVDKMTSNKVDRNPKLKQIIQLLKFAMTTDDKEITESIIESAIEMLEEEID